MKFYQELVLPLTWGGANTGTVLGKLNALFSSGGGISGFKYTKISAKDKTTTYTTKSSGFVLCNDTNFGNRTISITRNGACIYFYPFNADSILGCAFGIFTENAVISINSSISASINAHIFEFI